MQPKCNNYLNENADMFYETLRNKMFDGLKQFIPAYMIDNMKKQFGGIDED